MILNKMNKYTLILTIVVISFCAGFMASILIFKQYSTDNELIFALVVFSLLLISVTGNTIRLLKK